MSSDADPEWDPEVVKVDTHTSTDPGPIATTPQDTTIDIDNVTSVSDNPAKFVPGVSKKSPEEDVTPCSDVDPLPFDSYMYSNMAGFEGALTEIMYDESNSKNREFNMNNFNFKEDMPRLVVPMRDSTHTDLVKLETLTPSVLRWVRLTHVIVIIFIIVFLALILRWSNTIWVNDECYQTGCLNVSSFQTLEKINYSIICVNFAFNFLFAIWFSYAVAWKKGHRPETYWVLVLMPIACLYNNPIFYMDRTTFINVDPDTSFGNFLAVCRYISNSYTFSGIVFYFSLKFGSFTRHSNLDEPYSISFYINRSVAVWALFILSFTLTIVYKIEIDPLPFVSIISLSRDYSFPSYVSVSTITIGTIQILIIVGTLLLYFKFSHTLLKETYKQARLKYLGIIFFFRYTLLPWIIVIIVVTVCSSFYAANLSIRTYAPGSLQEDYILTLPFISRFPIVIFFTVFVALEAYLASPATYVPNRLERSLLDQLEKFKNITPQKRHDWVENRNLERITSMSEHSPITWEAPFRDNGYRANDPTGVVMDDVFLGWNCSWLIYLEEDIIHQCLLDNSQSGLKLLKIWREPVNDVMAFILYSQDTIMMVFRGTVSAANWKVNFRIAQVKHPPLEDPQWLKGTWVPPKTGSKIPYVHRGFFEAYKSVGDEMLVAVEALLKEDPERRVFVTGHSLGGAMATLCAFDVRVVLNVPEDRLTCITYGSPRVGNRAFSRRYAAAVFDSIRVVNHSDSVANIPKANGISSFKHVNRCLLVDSYGNAVLDPLFLDFKLFHGNGVLPHMMAAYETSLRQFILSCNHLQYDPPAWDFSIYDNNAMDAMQSNIEKYAHNDPLQINKIKSFGNFAIPKTSKALAWTPEDGKYKLDLDDSSDEDD